MVVQLLERQIEGECCVFLLDFIEEIDGEILFVRNSR